MQGVDISFTVCVFVLLRISPTFCSAVHRHPRQGITLLPQKPKIGRIGQRAGHAHSDVNINVEMRRRKRHARDAPLHRIDMCGCTSVPFTDVLVNLLRDWHLPHKIRAKFHGHGINNE